MSLKTGREKALEARIAELERRLAKAEAVMQRALAVLRGESVPRRDRRDYMKEFMRRKRAAAKADRGPRRP
jgi:uncharacterized coiled-coil protein SlyX